jgi:hypothetical protein
MLEFAPQIYSNLISSYLAVVSLPTKPNTQALAPKAAIFNAILAAPPARNSLASTRKIGTLVLPEKYVKSSHANIYPA